MNLEQKTGGAELETKSTIFLKIQIVFKGGFGSLQLDIEENIELPQAVYSISTESKTQQLTISAIFTCQTSSKTVTTFSTLPHEETLCIDTEKNTKIRVFFDEHYFSSKNEIDRLYKLLRWKYAIGRDKLTYHSETIFWSIDKKNWRPIVRCPSIENLIVAVHNETKLDTIKIKELLQRGETEPIFLEILREANSIAHTSLESGFVIAVSALEVGVKYLIKNHIPKTEWLMDEVPSPPIQRIVEKFFPILMPGFQITQKDNDTLKKIINIRNKIVHSGKVGNDRKTLFEMMNFINAFVVKTINRNLR